MTHHHHQHLHHSPSAVKQSSGITGTSNQENRHTGHRRSAKENYFGLALSATLHCLLGCGLGEVLGMVIGTWLHWSNVATMTLAIILGFVFGFAFGMLPLLRAGFPVRKAFRQVLVAEGLSIAVMEAVEVTVQASTPGVMNAHLTDWLFWKGMLLGLLAGFVAAFPVNYWFVRKGIRHQH